MQDFLIGDVLVLGLEGRLAASQFVQQHSQGPDVDPLIVGSPLDDFRRHVVDGPTEGLPLVEGRVSGPAEVGQLQHPVLDQYVLGLDVPVHDVLVVHVLEGRDGLLAVVGGLLLVEVALRYDGSTLARKSLNRHWLQYSSTRYTFLLSWKYPYILSRLGWFM